MAKDNPNRCYPKDVKLAASLIRWTALTLLLVASAVGGFAIYKDFPSGPHRFSAVAVGFNCPEGSSIELSAPPELNLSLHSDNTYDAMLTVTAATVGPHSCKAGIDLPTGAAKVPQLPDDQFSVPQGAIEGLSAGVMTAPLPFKHGDDEPEPVVAVYTGTAGFRRDGWGRGSFSIMLDNGIPSPFELAPYPRNPDDPEAPAVKLSILLPRDKADLVRILPTTSRDDALNGISWDNIKNESLYSVTFEDSRTRYWVDHLIDAMTVTIGALLGVILAVQGAEPAEKNAKETTSSRPTADNAVSPPRLPKMTDFPGTAKLRKRIAKGGS
ncbi:hypothetical protein [Actinoplanes sp. NPDC026623]|uniref:hypothetical protein n=1 Tax=Actinoplanes sp. NPDC026623 TaxID=3155610 RepID=UPI0033D16A27